MAERKATNKYYPPEWDPSKGSINKFRNSHPLRERAKHLDEGILRIRFEMPFNVWCTSCNSHIGKGVRYNADKSEAGKYYSTTIWQFRMKCHLCGGVIIIKTDPQNRDYACAEGSRRVVQEYGDHEEEGRIALPTQEEKNKLANDPFYRLEKSNEDLEKAKQRLPELQALLEHSESRADNYQLSRQLRNKFRSEKTALAKQKQEGLDRGLSVPLLPLTDDDRYEIQTTYLPSATPATIFKEREALLLQSTSIFKPCTHLTSKNSVNGTDFTLSLPQNEDSTRVTDTSNSATKTEPVHKRTLMHRQALKKQKAEVLARQASILGKGNKAHNEILNAGRFKKVSSSVLPSVDKRPVSLSSPSIPSSASSSFSSSSSPSSVPSQSHREPKVVPIKIIKKNESKD